MHSSSLRFFFVTLLPGFLYVTPTLQAETAEPVVALDTSPMNEVNVADFANELPDLAAMPVEATIHIAMESDAASADGSAERPFARISDSRAAILQNLEAGTSTRVKIGAGTYREDLRQWLRFDKAAPETVRTTLLVVEGEPDGTTILSGSDSMHGGVDFQPTGWKEVKDEPGLYENTWPFSAPPDAGPWIDSYGFALLPGLMQRSEMVWVNGVALRQVLTERYRWEDEDGPRGVKDRGTGKGGDPDNKRGQLVPDGLTAHSPATLRDPGTFAVYSGPDAPANLRGKIFMRLPADVEMAEPTRIEVGMWKGTAWSPLLAVRDKDNIILRDLVLRHATTGPMGSTLNITGCTGFLIERLNVSDNVASGISISSSHKGILRRVTANNNGSNGIGIGEGSSRILVEDSETSFNNYRGGWSGWTAWHASGSKSGGVEKVHFRRHASVGNYANGLWFDVYCRDVLVEDSFFFGNKRMGVMFELTKPRGGPQILRNSVCAFNDNTGIFLSMASNSAVLGCLLIGNGGGGFVEDESKDAQILYKFAPHPQGPKSAEDWQSVVVRDTIMASSDGRIVDYLSRKSTPVKEFPYVLSVLATDNNTYWSREPAGFRLPDETWGDLEQWREALAKYGAPGGRDAHSRWEDPGLAEDAKKEFRPGTDSGVSRRAREMGVVLPEASIAEYWRRMDAGGYTSPVLEYRRQHD